MVTLKTSNYSQERRFTSPSALSKEEVRRSGQYAVDEDVPTLTRRMAAGDEAAYRSFFAEYFPRMCAYGSKLTSGNEALAQDLVQDTLLRVVRNIKPMDSADELWCWLVLLLRCSFIDAVRKHKRYSSLLESYALNLELGSAPTKISLSNSEALYRALQRLRKEERKLLLAKYYDDSSYSEIASVLGISEKAIESRLGRLRRKMKTYLRGADL